MKLIRDVNELNIKNSVVAIGKFDGFHKGHMELINKMLAKQQEGYNGVVFTFSNPPASFLYGKEAAKIYSNEEKMYLLEQMGVDNVFECPLTEYILHMSPEDFIEQILVDKLDVKDVIVGSDFHFGRDRKGDICTLMSYGEILGFQVHPIEKLSDENSIISSTTIRKYIREGNLKHIKKLLNREYFFRGEVVYGNQLGRTIDIPTANLKVPEDKLVPPLGVYISSIEYDGHIYYGISNLGTKPTVDGQFLGLETFIFDFDENIYGQIIKVNLLDFVRPEKKFDSLENLVAQMNEDICYGKEYIMLL